MMGKKKGTPSNNNNNNIVSSSTTTNTEYSLVRTIERSGSRDQAAGGGDGKGDGGGKRQEMDMEMELKQEQVDGKGLLLKRGVSEKDQDRRNHKDDHDERQEENNATTSICTLTTSLLPLPSSSRGRSRTKGSSSNTMASVFSTSRTTSFEKTNSAMTSLNSSVATLTNNNNNDYEGKAILYDFSSSQSVQQTQMLKMSATIKSCAVSSDGTIAIIGGNDNKATVFRIQSDNENVNTNEAQILHTFQRTAAVTCVDLLRSSSSCNQLDQQKQQLAIVGGHDNKAIIYNLNSNYENGYDSGEEVQIQTITRGDSVSVARFSPDGTKLLVGDYDKKITIFCSSSCSNSSMSSSGSSTAGADNAADRFVEMYTLTEMNSIRSARFSHNSQLFIVGTSGGFGSTGIGVFDVSTGQSLKRYNFWVEHVHPSSNQILTRLTSTETSASIWSKRNPKPKRSSPVVNIYDVGFSPPDDSKIYACGRRNGRHKVIIYDLSSGTYLHTFERSNVINTAAFSPDGTALIAAGSDNMAIVYDLSSESITNVITTKNAIYDVGYFQDNNNMINGSNRVYVCGGDGKAVFYDLSICPGGELIQSFDRRKTITFASFGHSKMILGGCLKHLVVRESQSGTCTEYTTLKGKQWVRIARLSPTDENKVLVGLNDGTAAIYELSSGIKLYNFEREKECDISAVAFSADETMVIIGGSDNKAIVYDIASPGLARVLHTYTTDSSVRAVAFRPYSKEKELIVANGETATIHHLLTSKESHTFVMNDWIKAVGWSPDGSKVFVAGKDKCLHIYDAVDFSLVFTFLSHSPINDASFIRKTSNGGSKRAPSLAIISSYFVYIVPIHQYGSTSCFLPFEGELDLDQYDHHRSIFQNDLNIKKLCRITSGYVLQRRNRGGRRFLYEIVRNNCHHLLASSVVSHPEKVFAYSSSIQESRVILKSLYKNYHLQALRTLLTSFCFLPSTSELHLVAILEELLWKFAKDKNLEMVKKVLQAGRYNHTKGLIRHHTTHIMTKENNDDDDVDGNGRPLNLVLHKSSSSPHDLNIWKEYRKDEDSRIKLQTLRVLLPDLGSFESLKALLHLESNDPFDLLSLQLVINSHWCEWGQHFFFVQAIVYLIGLIMLTCFCEILSTDRRRTFNHNDKEGGVEESITSQERVGWTKPILATFVVVHIIYFSFVEYTQIRALGRYYCKNGWNLRQCLALVLSFVSIVMEFTLTPTTTNNTIVAFVSALSLLLNWFGILFYFRLFEGSAWIVYTLLRMIQRLFPFLAVMFIIILAFTLTFRTLYLQNTGVGAREDGESKAYSFGTGLEKIFFAGFFADIDEVLLEETYSRPLALSLTLFLLFNIAIVSLNALIAFISDIFDMMLDDRIAVLTRVKAECMMEMYCLMDEDRRTNIEIDNRWTYMLAPSADVDEEVDADGNGGIRKNDSRKEDNPLYRRANKRDIKRIEIELKQEMKKELEKMEEKRRVEMERMEKSMKQEMDRMKKEMDKMQSNLLMAIQNSK